MLRSIKHHWSDHCLVNFCIDPSWLLSITRYRSFHICQAILIQCLTNSSHHQDCSTDHWPQVLECLHVFRITSLQFTTEDAIPGEVLVWCASFQHKIWKNVPEQNLYMWRVNISAPHFPLGDGDYWRRGNDLTINRSRSKVIWLKKYF